MKIISLLTISFLTVSQVALAQVDISQTLDRVLKKSALYVHNGMGGCSGSFIQFNGIPDSKKALVLTNGHCTGVGSFVFSGNRYPNHGEVFKNRQTNVQFETQDRKIYKAQRLVVASMTGTDVAIYELESTFAEVKASGYEVLRVASQKTLKQGGIVGFSSAYWSRSWNCEAEGLELNLKEGPWAWSVGIGLVGNNCVAKPGASGSPLLNEQREVVGTVNTGHSGGRDCTIMNPCEVKDGISRGYNGKVYAMSIIELNFCVVDGAFDANAANCPLK